MDSQTYAERVARLDEVNKVVAKLDPAIRAEAFAILKPYVVDAAPEEDGTGSKAKPKIAKPKAEKIAKAPRRARRPDATLAAPISEAEEILVEEQISDTDSDNALLAVALFYNRHGRGPFELAHIKAIAAQFNLNIPSRLDKFLAKAKRGEPSTLVVRKLADGWKVQPSADAWLKSTYGVTLGRSPLPGGDDE